jgi:hypothetical protein
MKKYEHYKLDKQKNKTFLENQFLDFFKFLEEKQSSYMSESYVTINLSFDENKDLLIVFLISNQYNHLEINFDVLTKISEIFGTKSINVGEKQFNSGCETCDYGSSYSEEFFIKKPSMEILEKFLDSEEKIPASDAEIIKNFLKKKYENPNEF